MFLKTKFIFLFLFFILLQSCNNSAQIKPLTKENMTFNLEKAIQEENKLETELRLIKDLDEGIKQAQKEGKPILLIFTGLGVLNSRKLESEIILKNEKVFSLMKEKYINVWLYVDDRKGNGKKWSDLQAFKFNGNHQPQIFVLDANGKKLDGGMDYNESKNKLLPLLVKYAN